MITVEIKSGDNPNLAEIALCADDTGINFLIEKLISLKGRKDHLHLMTEEWAGADLSSVSVGGEGYSIINHLRIVKL